MARVIPIGQPVNEVERLAIAQLRDELPDDYLVVHNVELGERGRAPYEHDVIVVGEHAVYALEVKGYYGRVTGNKRDWYVRGRHRRSPLSLAFQKARVLSSQLRRQNGRLGQIWVEGVVFLANPKVEVAFEAPVATHVRTAETIVEALTSYDSLHLPHWPIKPALPFAKAIERVLFGGRPSPGRTHVGPYRLRGQIAQTEFFTDHEATNEALLDPESPQAPLIRLRLYRVDPYASPEIIERQRQRGIWEASVLRWLGDHPGLVSAGDPFFPEAEDLAVALPFEQAGGITLRSHLDRVGALSEEVAQALFEPAIDALGLAHSRGIVHRAITPNSFLFEEGRPLRLADFAFSARLAVGEPVDEALLQPRYSAPELFEGAAASPASDIFSLGAVLALALTGPLPFERSVEVTLPAGLTSGGPLAQTVAAMLDRDPLRRPADGYAVLERLVPRQTAAVIRTRSGQVILDSGVTVNGEYRVVSRLGPPRTRTTYEVEQRITGQRRALRVIEADAGLLESLREAFCRLYALRHPALIRLNDMDEIRQPAIEVASGRRLLLVDYEFVGGVSVEAVTRQGGLGAQRAAELMLELADLLAYLDARGLHHGGLSAQSVFVTEEGHLLANPPPSLLPTAIISPPAFGYLSPTSPPSLSEDLTAAAILAWELATGRHPFPGGVREPGARPDLAVEWAKGRERPALERLRKGLRPYLYDRTSKDKTIARFQRAARSALELF